MELLLTSCFTVGPTIVVGPLTSEFLESNFLTGPSTTVGKLTDGYVDVPRALAAGIRPKAPGSHRLLTTSLPWFYNVDTVAHTATVRPELNNRLVRGGVPTGGESLLVGRS